MEKQLKEQIKVVAEAREQAREALDAKNAAYTEWDNQHRALFDTLLSATQQVSDAEATLRELALKAYKETGNKAPALGVGIREVTKLDYNTKVAFDWAVEHTMALKLDTSAFEKIAKASPPSFVRVFQEPQATIATNLEVEEK